MKKELRKEILAKRNALSKQERCVKSEEITNKVIALETFAQSDIVLLYAPIKSEVETQGIFSEAKKMRKDIYYPRVLGEQMEFYHINERTEYEISAYGIREPKPESTNVYEPDKDDTVLVVMPGAAFDRDGNRIGYGGGYYDKYLRKLELIVPTEKICKLAVAYECQMVAPGKIACEPHDVKVDCVITEKEIYFNVEHN